MNADDLQARIDAMGPWFYPFEFPHGIRTTSRLPESVVPIFTTRLEMVRRIVLEHFAGRLSASTCLDIGCHEGFYTMAMAEAGFRRVMGLDARETSLAKARLVAEAFGRREVEFLCADLEEAAPETIGEYDVVLLLGVLYHLANPMRCLRNVARLTRELLIVETQVVPDVEQVTEWGARTWSRPYQGVLALIDESAERDAGSEETGLSGLVCCPSTRAVEAMLRSAGFRRVEIVPPPPGAYEQHRRGKRIVMKAYK